MGLRLEREITAAAQERGKGVKLGQDFALFAIDTGCELLPRETCE